jgi:hypothetical protein
MRARLESIWRSGKWLEALALIAGAVVVVVAVAALRGSGRSRGQARAGEPSTRHAPALVFADSPSGAAEAATTYLGLLAETAGGDSANARARVSAMTTGSLRTQLQQGLPVLARALRARLASTTAPAAFDGWPLGYRVMSFSAARTTVAVWHLDLVASSTLGLMTTDYATTTYEVRWQASASTWRIDRARNVPGPTPPPSNAPLPVVDRFATAVREFSGYRYDP